MTSPPPDDDPVLRQRARMKRLADIGKRVGYGLFLLAMAIFFIGIATDLTSAMTTAIVVCLIVGSIVLAPAIILGYAVGAAIREETGGTFH